MKTKKLISLVLALAMIASFAVLPLTANAAELVFSSNPIYKTSKAFSEYPLTYEATVKLPAGYSQRPGVIAGNYKDDITNCISFEVQTNGNPRIFVRYGSAGGQNISILFNNVNICTGEWVHVAIAIDRTNSKVLCYINGELKQTISNITYPAFNITNPLCLGADLRNGNAQYFKGNIKNVALYSDVRTASEISSDYTSGSLDDDGLICAYEISGAQNGENPSKIEDISGNGYDFFLNETWLETEPELEEYAYSFAVVGDTQIINTSYPQYFSGIYEWITDNAEKYNTKFIFGLGDITDKDADAEWSRAKSAFDDTGKKLPLSIVRGNHDSVSKYNTYFPYSEYGHKVSGSYDNTMLNTYIKFDVGNVKYLLVNLDFGAPDNILNWAGNIISENKDRNVIVTTHAYLFRDGTTLDKNDVVPPTVYGSTYNNGDDIWEKLIKKHENIVLVLSGHDPCDNVVMAQTEGENGNIVTQLLIDPQGTDVTYNGVGLVAMLHFSEDGKNVQLRYYY